MRLLAIFFSILFAAGQIQASDCSYATKGWWNHFWTTSEGWGQPSFRVKSLMEELDGSKDILVVVDVGSGNGRNSIAALMQLFEHRAPKSRFVVHCFDFSEEALRGLSSRSLPDWLQLVTHKVDVNDLPKFPKADLFLLYGILEYVKEENLSLVFQTAAYSLVDRGYLVVVVLVQGEGALEIAGETTRTAEVYTQHLKELTFMRFVDEPMVTKRPDRHDLGKGYPEDHLHYVYRSVLTKE
ncbi:MAG TPA: class I SAM-dependent methyltransferase [Rhabdochlamydiaceae bacterium]|nr:class I SAM-dependent methyltransferase [Rhabdochlamydiaceae bacterium]